MTPEDPTRQSIEAIQGMIADLEAQLMSLIDKRSAQALEATHGEEGARALLAESRTISDEIKTAASRTGPG